MTSAVGALLERLSFEDQLRSVTCSNRMVMVCVSPPSPPAEDERSFPHVLKVLDPLSLHLQHCS